ncbi:amidase [Mycobacterium sp. 21AC1]|uniref:amidase n=1 Tax=[Mycobacterium] appelbergii TaxID=2939269 RepID=UPI002939330B|nr:amidase [Mycobacterium sp. 21AC1]MDV3127551.1 amidase [Mycobacterium sp. 21AC1]
MTGMPTSVRSAAEQIRAGDLTPSDLLDLSITRMRQVDPLLQAFVAFDEQRTRDDAATLTREAAAGRIRGPLHGVPVAVKDVVDVAGMPTRGGSRVTDAAPAVADAVAVSRLRSAGALILGKTRTHELAHGVTTPPSRNPWDPERIPGGSSGGSAVAVASGQCLAAIGSDTGGSVRVPAALCGVSGLRPARGDVPVDGLLGFSPRLDTCGPIARDALDLTLLFEVLSDRACPAPVVRGIRIGTVGPRDIGELSDGVAEGVAEAVQELAAAGAEVCTVEVPSFRAWSAPRAAYVLADFLDTQRSAGFYPRHRDAYGEEVASYLRQAERITPAARAAAVDELERLARGLHNGMSGVDVLVLPTTPTPAPRVADCVFDPHAQGRASVIETLMRLCGPFSWCGFAAVTVPCGSAPGRLPVGMQIAGRNSATVLAVAAAYQARTAHHLREPAAISRV